MIEPTSDPRPFTGSRPTPSNHDASPWGGVWTALATPFEDDGRAVDIDAFVRLCERQLDGGVSGLVPCGTTGEASALVASERDALLRAAVDVAEQRGRVLMGAGSNRTAEAVARTERAAELGADAALHIVPYYVKPNPAGLVAHFGEIARVGLPIVIYDVPSRVAVGLDMGIYRALSEFPQIVATKDASTDLDLATQIIAARRFTHLSGDDALAAPHYAIGSSGIVSVISNLVPARVVAADRARARGDFDTVREMHHALSSLTRALFQESNPVPLKAALEMLGLCGATVRTPLGAASASTRDRLQAELDGLAPMADGRGDMKSSRSDSAQDASERTVS